MRSRFYEVIGKALFVFAMIFMIGCKEQILHDLTEAEGSRLITRLHQVGIAAEKRAQPDGSWALAVDSSDSLRALSALSDARVFRKISSPQKELSQGMLPSKQTQQFQFERAISSEVELTLTALPGVLEARVHLNLPPSDPLFGSTGEENFRSSASVLLITDQKFGEEQANIRGLISGASGVELERISVLVSSFDKPVARSVGIKEFGVTQPSQALYGPQLKEESQEIAIVSPDTSSAAVEALTTSKDRTGISELRWWVIFAILLLLIGVLAVLHSQIDLRRVLRRKVKRPTNFQEQLAGLADVHEEVSL